MTTWGELRTVALVGTERRSLPTAVEGSMLRHLPDDVGAEATALHAAALLGIARRTGQPVQQTNAPTPSASSIAPNERTAPNAAIQLLELMLTGNTGPGTMSNSLLDQWFRTCSDNDTIVPHRLLVAVLDSATTTRELRATVMPVLGSRGRWLAAQRDKWSWAAADVGAGDVTSSDDTESAQERDLDEVLQLPADHRDALFVAARATDDAAGRRLIAEACTKLDAASRARVLGLLREHLGDDDEVLLESALDDRSKAVRSTAIELLNGLTRSERATRLSRQLEPLVTKSGKLRKTIAITFPATPEDEQLRDLPPAGRGVVEQQWFDTLIAGTPLSWWEDTLAMSPSKIVGTKLSHPDELLHAWRQAAIAQRNQDWLGPLFDKTKDPTLLPFIGTDAAAGAFLASLHEKTADRRQVSLLTGVAGPWSDDFTAQVLKWARDSNDGKGAITRMNMAQSVMAECLAPSAQSALETWLDQVRGDEHQALQRVLRNLIQQLSFRTSIDKAFT